MLRLRHVWRTYPVGDDEVVALRDVDLEIRDADFMAIVGPSGSGKSTLLQIVGLLDSPTRGVVELDGHDLHDLDDAARTRLRLTTLGFVFQRFHLLNDLSAIENVTVPMEALGLSAGERYERAAWLLKAVGLGERLDFRPSRLSGGQRQRVAIARALANDPLVILADEPTGNLDSASSATVRQILRELVDQQHKTVIAVTHDASFAAAADRRALRLPNRKRKLSRPKICRRSERSPIAPQGSQRRKVCSHSQIQAVAACHLCSVLK